jgi:hypothetical protein
MANPLVVALLEGMRHTTPFRALPATNRPTEELWSAHNDVMLKLRLPLHHERLRKAWPKQATFDAAIQSGLAILSRFAATVGTHQAIVRIERGSPEVISFQPRPLGGANWTRTHCISPVALQNGWTDPLRTHDEFDGRTSLTTAVGTRDILHLASGVAIALGRQVERHTHPSGTATLIFNPRGKVPGGRIVYRPRDAGLRNLSARTVVLAG